MVPVQRRQPLAGARSARLPLSWLALLALLALCGCSTARHAATSPPRPFHFYEDTFAYANELVWEYSYDDRGNWTTQQREPKPDYTLHCFVLAEAARQFFWNARFDSNQPAPDPETCRKLIRRVVKSSPRKPLPDAKRIVIPGYPNLREFSRAQEAVLKDECGGAWNSYFQRGHWRMIFPLSRSHQEKMSDQICRHLRERGPVIVHVVRFPQLSINHALVIYDVTPTPDGEEFAVYDPNQPSAPARLTFHRATRTFELPANSYFQGGRVDVYEIFHRWNY